MQKIIEIPQNYINKINIIMFHFLWEGIDKINRKAIINNTYMGGIALTYINTSIITTHVQRIKNIIENKNQPYIGLDWI